MADADFGYVGGAPGKIDLYVGKEVVKRAIPNEQACDELVQLIKARAREDVGVWRGLGTWVVGLEGFGHVGCWRKRNGAADPPLPPPLLPPPLPLLPAAAQDHGRWVDKEVEAPVGATA